MEQLKYPIGKFEYDPNLIIEDAITYLEEFPHIWQAKIATASAAQLNQPYRPGGWTLRQLIHHVPDSHVNAYIRFKWTLTEDQPMIKAYFEDRWATLEDNKLPIQASIDLLNATHVKWTALMRVMPFEQWQRSFIHPETKSTYSLRYYLGSYVWHSKHHLAHLALVLG